MVLLRYTTHEFDDEATRERAVRELEFGTPYETHVGSGRFGTFHEDEDEEWRLIEPWLQIESEVGDLKAGDVARLRGFRIGVLCMTDTKVLSRIRPRQPINGDDLHAWRTVLVMIGRERERELERRLREEAVVEEGGMLVPVSDASGPGLPSRVLRAEAIRHPPPQPASARDMYPRPDWEEIASRLDPAATDASQQAFWDRECRAWLESIVERLEPGYRIHESENFATVVRSDERHARVLAAFLERTRSRILSALDGIAFDEGFGKHGVLGPSTTRTRTTAMWTCSLTAATRSAPGRTSTRATGISCSSTGTSTLSSRSQRTS